MIDLEQVAQGGGASREHGLNGTLRLTHEHSFVSLTLSSGTNYALRARCFTSLFSVFLSSNAAPYRFPLFEYLPVDRSESHLLHVTNATGTGEGVVSHKRLFTRRIMNNTSESANGFPVAAQP